MNEAWLFIYFTKGFSGWISPLPKAACQKSVSHLSVIAGWPNSLIPECKLTIAVALLLKPKWSFVWSVRCTDRGVHPMKWEYHLKVSKAHISHRVITHRLMYLKCLGFCLVCFIILMKIFSLNMYRAWTCTFYLLGSSSRVWSGFSMIV